MATDKPGKFDFIKHDEIRLAYAYAYREMTKAGLWEKMAILTSEEIFKTEGIKNLKMRKGSHYAATLVLMWMIASKGWDTAVQKLLAKQEKTDIVYLNPTD